MEQTAKHILMIDNDPTSKRLFGSLLAKAGYEVLYASSGEEGRETARRLHPDLILMDINMPGGDDGWKTADLIRNEKDSPAADIPIAFLSSTDLPLEAQTWMKDFGVTDYIQKGASNEEFVLQVKKMFDDIEKRNLATETNKK